MLTTIMLETPSHVGLERVLLFSLTQRQFIGAQRNKIRVRQVPLEVSFAL